MNDEYSSGPSSDILEKYDVEGNGAQNASTTPSLTRWQFRANQIQLFYQQAQTELLVSMLIAVVVCTVFWRFAPPAVLLAWTIALIVTVGSRSLMVSSSTAKAAKDNINIWGMHYIIGSMVTGICWGSLGIFPVLYGDYTQEIFVLFVLIGVTLTAYISMQSSPPTFAAFMVPALLPYSAWQIHQGDNIQITLGILSILFGCMMWLSSRQIRTILTKSFSLGSHNTELIRKLVAARESAEKSKVYSEKINRALQDEVRERQRAEERIRSSEQKLSAIFNSLQDIIFQINEDGRIIMITPSVRQMLGYTIDELLDTRIQDLYLHISDHRELTQKLDANYGRLQHYETRLKHREGTAIWISVNSHYKYDDNGDISGIEGTMRDITALKKAEEALYQEQERAQVTLGSIGDGVITTDINGAIEYMNPVAELATGWSLEETRGQDITKALKLIDEKSQEVPSNPVRSCLNEGRSITLAGHLLLAHRYRNQQLSIEVNAAPINDSSGRLIGVVLVFHDVTELRGLAKQMSHQAMHDALTGLINRREFETRVMAAVENARNEGSRHALCYLDLDQFKVVNDTCGHIAGDELLKQLTIKLREEMRESDTLARLGGDEFGILLEGCSVENAREPAENLRQIVENFRFAWDDKSFRIGVSIGMVPITNESGTLSDVLSAADSACYVAKESGRNRVHIFQPDDTALAERHGQMQWVQRIQSVLENNRFRLYFQPIAQLNGDMVGKVHGEVLLRMLDESNELVGPGSFLPSAERYNLMPSIDRWVVENTFTLLNLGNNLSDKIGTCCINLSGQSLSDERFLEFIISQMKNSRLRPSMLCFEITETAIIANLSNATKFITTLREMGCQFALDDFGSGLSSFGYLKNLAVDYLKLDGCFVKNMIKDDIDKAMVMAINQIGHVMNIKTIAEFVEDEVTLEAARAIGIDYAQGYAIAKPVPIEAGLYKGPVILPDPSESRKTDGEKHIILTEPA